LCGAGYNFAIDKSVNLLLSNTGSVMEIEESENTNPTPPAVLDNSENFAAQISLPEGHQITIGELDPGTLVEIATWHGTGRPDESAHRFLLSAEGIGLTRRRGREAVPVKPVVRTGSAFNNPVVGKSNYLPNQNSNSGLSDLTGFHPLDGESVTQDDEPYVNVWIERGKSFGFTALVIVLIGVIFQVYGLSTTVPDQGPKTFFGSTTTSLIIYKKTKEVVSGNVMVVKSKVEGVETVYFGAASINGEQLTLGLEGKNVTLSTKDIAGKGFFLVPFIGGLIKKLPH
jgi:hypothetical protein